MDRSLVLVTVTGPDRPGITSGLMKALVKNQAKLLDMGQAVTHGLLSLSILLDIDENESHPTLKDLLFEAKHLGMDLDFEIVDNLPEASATGDKYILSCVGITGITAAFMADMAETLAQHKINIQRIDNMTGRTFKAMEIAAQSVHPVKWEKIKTELMNVSNRHGIDIAFMRDNVFRHNKRLIVFDMDSTLINAEVIDELAVEAGVGDQVKAITARAMNGEMNFDQSLRERVALLKGLKREVLKKVHDRLELNPGVEQFIRAVKSLGYKTAIVSGGFKFFAEELQQRLGMDYVFANELEFSGDELTGRVTGEIVNAEKKAFILELLAQQESIHLEQVVAIGDGANDLPMLAKAGLGIAFHAKEKVRKEARHQLGHGPMTSILYFLGIPGSHLDDTP
ncbi:MAG: phosphoserine phosphatase SerB [Bacteriovoracia bacterium]